MHQAVYKVAEFVAHSAEVLDVNIGRKSGDLLATCGADRKVNIWSLQSGNNLMVRAARNAMPPLRTTPCHNPHGFETPRIRAQWSTRAGAVHCARARLA
jgi:WD40 repeat protein